MFALIETIITEEYKFSFKISPIIKLSIIRMFHWSALYLVTDLCRTERLDCQWNIKMSNELQSYCQLFNANSW